MKNKDIIKEITDWYCAIVACVVTLTALCIMVFGGKFSVEIHWYTFIDLMKTIFKKPL